VSSVSFPCTFVNPEESNPDELLLEITSESITIRSNLKGKELHKVPSEHILAVLDYASISQPSKGLALTILHSNGKSTLSTVDILFSDNVTQVKNAFQSYFPFLELEKSLHYFIVFNPSSGKREAERIARDVIAQVFRLLSVSHQILQTKGDDEFRLGREIISLSKDAGLDRARILILGGDGTVNELINGLFDQDEDEIAIRFDLSILPLGTANAFYHSAKSQRPSKRELDLNSDTSIFHKVISWLSTCEIQEYSPLSICRTSFFDNASPIATHSFLSFVVVSTSLHASILYDSEKLRQGPNPIYGIERFKVAAEQNINRWFYGNVKLLGDRVLKWEDDRWIETQERELKGPFIYCNGMLTDRLEEKFIVDPLRKFGEGVGTIDLVTIRPLRSSEITKLIDMSQGNDEHAKEAKKKVTEKMLEVFRGMYQDGAHLGASWEDGTPTVEFWRVEGWEWASTVS
jgi:hypothetical protein